MSRIIFLISQSLESPSGLGRYNPLARELAKLGHSVEIFALHPAYDELESKNLDLDGVKVHYLAQMHVMKSGDTKSYYSTFNLLKITFKATWRLYRSAANTQADIVYVGKPHPMNSIAGMMATLLNRSELYLDCDDYEAGSGRFAARWQKSIISFFEKWMPHRAKLISTNTMFMQDKLRSWGVPANKIIYLPNGVDQFRFTKVDQAEVDSLHSTLDLRAKKVVGYFGSLSLPSHPVDILLEAFQKIHASDNDTVLMLVGGGEDLLTLKKLAGELGITEATRFCGRVPPEKIPFYYALADVAIDPVYDNDAARGRSPLKMFESWVCGVPFVTADVGDRITLLGDPPAGLVAEPGNAESLASRIREVLGNGALAGTLSEAGKTRVSNYYWDRLAQDLNQIFPH